MTRFGTDNLFGELLFFPHSMSHDTNSDTRLESCQLTNVQPAITSPSCFALPAETIYYIFRFVCPQDLIRLRAVSKLFRDIVDNPLIWRIVYATACLPLPPGPFPWQSTSLLQRAVVHSTRLERVWTTDPLTLISRRVFKGPRSIEDDRLKWVRGRWLIVSKDMRQLRSRDVETGTEQLLWDQGPFAFWSAASVMNPVGHFLYVAVHLVKGRPSDPVKLLEFVVDDDTGHLSGPEMLDVPTWSLPKESFIPRIRVDSGMAPRFYKFPLFRTQLDLLLNYRGAWLPHLVEVYFTRTHLFVLNRSYLIHGFLGNVEVIQVFAIPDHDPDLHPESNNNPILGDLADPDGHRPIVRELRLTHELLSQDTGSLWLTPIRGAVVDPITRTTTLRFMHTYAPFQPARDSRARIACTDYILPAPRPSSARPSTADRDLRAEDDPGEDNQGGLMGRHLSVIVPSTEEVLPIIVTSHDIFSVQGVWNGNLVDASDDGFVRGLCFLGCYPEGSNTPDTGIVHKFTVDATGERCTAVVGDQCLPWEGLDPARSYEYSFDGTKGKLWNTKGDVVQNDSSGRPVDTDVLAIVTDFK